MKQIVKVCERYIMLLLFFGIFGMGIFHTGKMTQAATGIVSTSGKSLNVRSGPGGEYQAIGMVAKATQVSILSEENGWYKITFGSGTGYVSKEFIKIEETTNIDAYAEELIKKGFPKSYAGALSSLHKKYPNWVFQPVSIGIEWDTVIEQESKLGRNLVQSFNNDAQKSTAAGAYNWETNQWFGYDGSGWVCASKEMIAYCMDPRNFLNGDDIFQFATNEYQTYQNATGVKKLLADSFMKGNYKDTDGKEKNYADTFVTVGKAVGVSPYHLAVRCLQEQGSKGAGASISGTVSGYENYFNYFHIGAYPINSVNSVKNGLNYAKKKGWNTRYASILGGAKIVGNDYVKKGQDTVYFEKFNVVNKISGLYAHQYMTNVQAAITEGKNIKKAYTDSKQAVVFRIPVYKNMPETACVLPTNGNPNNWLKSLQIKNYKMTPTFDPEKTEYSLTVDKNVSSVQISGTAVVSASSIIGTGNVELKLGTNTITISCKAQNGSVRNYILTIVRGEPNMAVSKGDVNEDGQVSLADLVAIKRHLLNIETLKEEVADVDANGEIGLADYVKIKRHILGYELLN